MSWNRAPEYVLRRLSSAAQRQVEASGGPKQAAEVSRTTATLLSRYGLYHYSDQMPADVAWQLGEDSGEDYMLHCLASLRGYVLLPTDFADGDLNVDFAELGKQASHLFSLYAEFISPASEGGRELTPNEQSELHNGIQDLLSILTRMQRNLSCEDNVTHIREAR